MEGCDLNNLIGIGDNIPLRNYYDIVTYKNDIFFILLQYSHFI